jgi:Phage integrase, N-terminal SAM-like domain
MSELRTRMLRDMTVRGFSPRTHEAYIRQVVGLARHYRRSPDQLSADESRRISPTSTRGGNARGARAPRRRTRSGFSTT